MSQTVPGDGLTVQQKKEPSVSCAAEKCKLAPQFCSRIARHEQESVRGQVRTTLAVLLFHQKPRFGIFVDDRKDDVDLRRVLRRARLRKRNVELLDLASLDHLDLVLRHLLQP